MLDHALLKDLAEMMGRSLTFTDIEAVGGYLFKDHGFRTHDIAGVDRKISISPLNAARRLVEECERKGRIGDLLAFAFELDGAPLNGRSVKLEGMESLLYNLSRSGTYYDFAKRRLVGFEPEKKSLPGWGVLKSGREYPITVASVDICQNSELVRKHRPAVMEKVYYRLWDFLKRRLDVHDGRMWSWAGDGGLAAFRGDHRTTAAVSCCLEILYGLPVFNLQPDKPIPESLCLRIALDTGPVKFSDDTGRIVSEVINYAAHLEKKGTEPGCLSVSDAVYAALPVSMRGVFTETHLFEGRTAWSTPAPVKPGEAPKAAAPLKGRGKSCK
jgi:class 3 adenylate cyclase